MRKLVASQNGHHEGAILTELFRVMEAPFILRTLVVLRELGVTDKMIDGEHVNIRLLEGSTKFYQAAFRFLESIGYVTRDGENYQATELGREMFINTPKLADPDNLRIMLDELEDVATGKKRSDGKFARTWAEQSQVRNEMFYVMEGSLIMRTLIVLWKTGANQKLAEETSGVPLKDLAGDPEFLLQAYRYLESIGYVTVRESVVRMTPLGRGIIGRTPSFGVPDSYRVYMNKLEDIARGLPVDIQLNDRAINVEGSGRVNRGRYYPRVLPTLTGATHAKALLDVGCGMFNFSSFVESRFPNRFDHAGADYHKDALRVARDHVRTQQWPGRKPVLFQGNVMDPAKLAADLATNSGWNINPQTTFVSVWYIFQEGFRALRELAKAKVVLPELLRRYHAAFGGTGMIIAEMFDLDPQKVFESRWRSVAAPYRYFHDISGQVLLPVEWWFDAIEASEVWKLDRNFIPIDMVGREPDPQTWLGVFPLRSY